MIDIKEIRENPQLFRDAAAAKKCPVDIDRLLEIEAELRQTKTAQQKLVAEKNRIGKDIPRLSPDEKKAALARLAEIKQAESGHSDVISRLQPEFDDLMLLVAQPAAPEVPFGEDDTQNVELRKWGTIPSFDFPLKDHLELGQALDMIDIERGVKLAGTRNYFLKGDGALLHWAVLRYAMDIMLQRGFTPMNVPLLMKDSAMRGTAYFPGGEDQAYRMERDELNLAGTAEVPLTAYHSEEILAEADLPKKYVALSTCFRREAGAAGKDTRGLYRIHQFDKVEQVIVCRNDVDESVRWHAEILANSEALLQGLGLPYRVVNVCTGDLGRGQVQKFDLETWMPSRNSYGETHSASRFYEFQARRMNLRYKTADGKRNLFCHTLNNTVVASPRILIPIMELYQNADGSITIPEVLRPYMNNRDRIIKA